MGENIEITGQRIAISGATGFIGTHLSSFLSRYGYQIIPLTRDFFTDTSNSRLEHTLSECDAVINLAGASINHRWSKSYKQLLIDSRVDVTRKLVNAANKCDKIKTFISVSAVGYYPNEGCYDEYSDVKGNGFLSDLCQKWENEAKKISPDIRLVITRFGVVLAERGGAFEQLAQSSRLGISVIAGNGKQVFSWIDIEDLCRVMKYILSTPQLAGIFNLTAPQPLPLRELMKSVGKHYKALFSVPVPAFVFKLLLGEASDFLLKSQCAKPTRLIESEYSFSSPDIDSFLEKIP